MYPQNFEDLYFAMIFSDNFIATSVNHVYFQENFKKWIIVL